MLSIQEKKEIFNDWFENYVVIEITDEIEKLVEAKAKELEAIFNEKYKENFKIDIETLKIEKVKAVIKSFNFSM